MDSTAISGYNAFPSTPGTKPLDNLKVQELQTELRIRGVATQGKLKPELAKEFEDLHKGIVNVPALLQRTPDTPLKLLGLDRYEIAPTEPLHDIKGHISNLIKKLLKVVTGELLEKLE